MMILLREKVRRSLQRPSVVLVLCIILAFTAGVWLWLGSVLAFAAGGSHPFLASFGRSATEAFTDPNGIAVDESSGVVYVADMGTEGSVYKFDAEGKPVNFSALGSNQLTGVETSAKSFSFPNIYGTPAAIAVDNSTNLSDPSRGNLYVMDTGHGVIDKFDATGKYLSQISGFKDELLGLGIDASGTLHVELSSGSKVIIAVDLFDDAMTNHLAAHQLNEHHLGEEAAGVPATNSPQTHGFAVAPSGDNYPLYESPCSCTLRLGQQLSGLGRLDSAGSGDIALAVDPATGHVFIDDQSSVAEWDAGAMDRGSLKGKENEVSGTLVSRFGSEQLSGSSAQGGIAVDGTTGDIYVSNPADGRVYMFASDAPGVVAGATSAVAEESVTLDGTVNPRGAAVISCVFEYEAVDIYGHGGYGQKAECDKTTTEIGHGTTPVQVSAHIGGLKAGLLYHYRLSVTNAAGSSSGAGLFATSGDGFGVTNFEVSFLNADGTPDTQAGSHPDHMVTSFTLASHYQLFESNADSPYVQEPNGTLKDLLIDLPPGFIGNPNATSAKCTPTELSPKEKEKNPCPPESVFGLLQVSFSANLSPATGEEKEIYNMVPPHGVAFQLGAFFINPLVFINSGVLVGGDYPIQVKVEGASAEPVISSVATLPGVVGVGSERKAALTLPTGCRGPLRSTIRVDSWQEPGRFVEGPPSFSHNAAGVPVSLTGCSKLKFSSEIGVVPDSSDASTSSGLAVHIKVPQSAAFYPEGLAESSVRNTTVTLPEGMSINPAGADGLEACTSNFGDLPQGALGSPGDQIGFLGAEELDREHEPGVRTDTFTPEVPVPLAPGSNFCPDGSKIGTVKIKTPLLEHELEGAVYLAAQNANPFGSLVAMYMVVEDPFSGSLVKLAGEVKLSPSGQIVTTFDNTPDLPFEELELHFFGGERAPLSTPSRCGTYTTKAVFTPWDGNGPVTSESSFTIDHGPHGGPCPGQSLPFQPSLAAGTVNNQAGGFSPFTMTMSREDGNQSLQSVSLKTPPGLSGLLTGVELCPEAQANAGECGPNSLIGETTVSVGVGNDPFTVKGGKVYLTGPYRGAPFGLSIVNPAKAGPYDVEHDTSKPTENMPACDCIVVRAKIEVDPITTALTVTSDSEGPYKIPTVLDGIPLQIQHVNVTIGRPGFTFNPTNCSPTSITGNLQSSEGASSLLSVPFQAANCARLGFKPQFKISTSGRTSRVKGASLHVLLSYPKLPFGSQANIAMVKVDLPKQLPSRLSTLQKACVDRVFAANPAACPAASKVGTARAVTPLLPVPLTGPAYFVSHGGAKFPELVVVLQGYGVTVDLHSETFINEKTNITSSIFRTVPDAPVGTFELTLPQGPTSALAANGNLCAKTTKTVRVKQKIKSHSHTHTITRRVHKSTTLKLAMPTAFTAQNGATIHQRTPITITGCPKTKANHKPKNKNKH